MVRGGLRGWRLTDGRGENVHGADVTQVMTWVRICTRAYSDKKGSIQVINIALMICAGTQHAHQASLYLPLAPHYFGILWKMHEVSTTINVIKFSGANTRLFY